VTPDPVRIKHHSFVKFFGKDNHMTILRKKARTNYTHIDNEILQDKRLSYRARGIAAFLLSKPDGWKVKIDYIATQGEEGTKAVTAALKELATYGYLMRSREGGGNTPLRTHTDIADYPAFIDEGTPESRLTGYSRTDPAETEGSVTEASVREGSVTGGSIVSKEEQVKKVNPDKKELNSVSFPAAQGERKTSAKKNQPETHPNTAPIMEAYCSALGYQPGNYAKEAKAAKAAAKAGYTPEDISAAYAMLKEQKFWQSKHIGLDYIVQEIPALLQAKEKGLPVNGNGYKSNVQESMDAIDRVFDRIMQNGGKI
jgi:hypothetical protein